MIRPDRDLPALLLSLLLAACGPAAPAVTPAPSASAAAAPAPDDGPARRAAAVTLNPLTRRKFNVAGCAAADARVVTEAEASAPPPASDRCTMLVARRADKTWLVVVRTPAQAGAWAVVTVSAGAEGVLHIDYKP